MEVKMYTANATGTQNIVELINEDLKAQGEIIPKLTLHCIAFEANPGTAFSIPQKSPIVISDGLSIFVNLQLKHEGLDIILLPNRAP